VLSSVRRDGIVFREVLAFKGTVIIGQGREKNTQSSFFRQDIFRLIFNLSVLSEQLYSAGRL
jgi:hypothetical protein